MDRLIPYTLLLVAVIGLGVTVRVFRQRLKRTSDELVAIEGEEERMFRYLHDLGMAIGKDTTQLELSKMIVDGVNEVVSARGGAIYLLDDVGELLQPKYLSKDCPPLVGVPAKIRKKSELDPRATESYLRLFQAPVDTGLLGAALGSELAIHVPDIRYHEAFRDVFADGGGERVEAMLSPLRHAGKDLGVLAVTRTKEQHGFSANDFAVFRSAAEQSAFAMGNAMLYREATEKRQFESELRNASEVQRVLLPQGEPIVPGYRLSGTNVPARIISGDYYDHLDLGDGRHGVVIADVSGKGVGAGLLMAMCRSVLRSQAWGKSDPAEVLGGVNRQLFPDIREDMFISLFYGVIDGESGLIRVARAGHDEALLYRAAKGIIETVKPPGLALGIDDGDVFERVTKVLELQMDSGDLLLFYTDGVNEATNGAGDEFGMKRLKATFLESAALGAEAAVNAVQRDLAAFAGGSRQMDDITLFAVEKR
ncbi:PP2C family protein-serine/threonine phosphatase [Haloferula chungangensis]|uniref:PP2C family protein-serine/threonine phosphatase n=1 Tax=Haloferula chungangensis TaxID=1048331 RepID=A0ABW2L4M9_9BACT